MKIFAIYVGGKTENSNIEVHDMRFVVGQKIEDCYEQLRKQWWGTPQSLHIDCWGALEYVDGYKVSLKPEAYEGAEKLYFVNLGGYDLTLFTELHSNVFVVGETESKAKVRALKTILDWNAHHKDNQFEIEMAICLNQVVYEKGLHVHLEKSDISKPFEFTCRYLPIAV